MCVCGLGVEVFYMFLMGGGVLMVYVCLGSGFGEVGGGGGGCWICVLGSVFLGRGWINCLLVYCCGLGGVMG